MRISDWSSDVCSSDLADARQREQQLAGEPGGRAIHPVIMNAPARRVQPLWFAGSGHPPRDGKESHDHNRLEVSPPRLTPPRRDPISAPPDTPRSEEHTSELQSLMRISYAVFCLK